MQPTPARTARGFTIVEVMVGLVLGMIGIIIMYQVFAVFEGQRRTTVTGGNAQTAGHLSMYGIERDLRLAGLGLFNSKMATSGTVEYTAEHSCLGGIRTYSADGLGWSGAGSGPALPVSILEGGARSDEFTVTYAESALAGTFAPVVDDVSSLAAVVSTGVRVNNVPFIKPDPDPTNPVFKKDDFVVLAKPTNALGLEISKRCMRMKITEITREGDYLRMKFEPGNLPPNGQPENPPAGTADFFPPSPEIFKGDETGKYAYIKAMGRSLAWARYSVDSATLQLMAQTSDQPPPGVAVAQGVVGLQVQFGVGPKDDNSFSYGGHTCAAGRADPVCQNIARWVDAVDGAGYGGVNWGKLTAADESAIMRIKAVRVAIAVRSENLERDSLYGAAGSGKPINIVPLPCVAAGQVVDAAGHMCAWADGTNADPAGPATAPLIDLSKRPDGATPEPNWDRYRYRVYETVVPFRNVLWSTKGSS